MVIAARAKLLAPDDLATVDKIVHLLRTKSTPAAPESATDALSVWFSRESVAQIRAVEKSFMDAHGVNRQNGNGSFPSHLPKTISFFYVALFRVVRHFLAPFLSSNPTWIRKPRLAGERIRLSRGRSTETFVSICLKMLDDAGKAHYDSRFKRSRVDLASAESLPLQSESVDFVLTSPPYCTRLDYAVATMPELAVLGCGGNLFTQLRRALTGTLTVNKLIPSISPKWGGTCEAFLKNLRNHPSKASGTYYLKTHLQYFESVERSLAEIYRVLRSRTRCVIVVQDSYYKDVRNDLPRIFTDMAEIKGFKLARREDFELSRSMARINPRARKYRQSPTGVESVLCFSKA
jgi:hypothetical protein